jgi:hypothetical protein
MNSPPRWIREQLQEGLQHAKEQFRQERMQEPLEAYLDAFDRYQGFVENLLETSIDLVQLDSTAVEILTNPDLLEAFRYLAGPPLSARRSESKDAQEQLVEDALTGRGFHKVPTRAITTLNLAPGPGEFCREAMLGERKADFTVGLWDHRVMAIECKVSNSSTNSVKRLNNDAAVKAEIWYRDFGTKQIIPVALLSGVYKIHNLENAQNRGLTLFWAHSLKYLTDWIEATRTA